MRIVVIGTSGAGKTTLARRIASRLELPHIELDAINWQSGWHDLTRHDPQEFVRRVTEAIQAEAWVVDGNYGPAPPRNRTPVGATAVRSSRGAAPASPERSAAVSRTPGRGGRRPNGSCRRSSGTRVGISAASGLSR